MRKKILSIVLAIIIVCTLIPLTGITITAAVEKNPENCGLCLKYPSSPNSETNPYLISSVEDWMRLTRVEVFRKENYFLQTVNLDFSTINFDDLTCSLYTLDILDPDNVYSTADIMIGLNGFQGTYDGGGHTVSGVNINSDIQNVSLFYKLKSGTVKNLTVKDCSFASTHSSPYVGGIVALACGGNAGNVVYNKIENCIVTDSVKLSATGTYRVGGIVGDTKVDGLNNIQIQILNCVSAAQITLSRGESGGPVFAGGIVGIAGSTKNSSESFDPVTYIKNCVYIGKITVKTNEKAGQNTIGGIAGELNHRAITVENCYANIEVDLSFINEVESVDLNNQAAIGGIVGTLNKSKVETQESTIKNCYVNLIVTQNTPNFPVGFVSGNFGGATSKISNITYVDRDYIDDVVKPQTSETDVTKLSFQNVNCDSESIVENLGQKLLCSSIRVICTYNGASIKIDSTQSALRFKSYINDDAVALLRKLTSDTLTITSKGTLVTATASLTEDVKFTEESLTIAEKAFEKIVFDETTTGWYKNTEGMVDGNFKNFANKTTEYLGIGYMTFSVRLNGDTNDTVITSYADYSSTNSRSVKSVAVMALKDVDTAYNETQKSIFNTLAG